MVSLYRISVNAINGTQLIMNMFEAKSDAEACYKAIASGSNGYENLVEATPFDSLLVKYEELTNGVWTTVTCQMLIRSK